MMSEKQPQQSNSRILNNSVPDKKLLNHSLDEQLDIVRGELSSIEKLFSHISHNKVIEKASDILSSTLFRAKPLLFASILALLGITLGYLGAKYYGFQLSGAEIIVSFITGWVVGLIYEIVSTRKK